MKVTYERDPNSVKFSIELSADDIRSMGESLAKVSEDPKFIDMMYMVTKEVGEVVGRTVAYRHQTESTQPTIP